MGLQNVDDKLLEMAKYLALAPSNRFYEGIQLLREEVFEYDMHLHEKLNKFLDYLKRYWGPKRKTLCVGHLPHRTNNLSESLNHRLGNRLGGVHPGIWKFLGKYI